MHYAELKSAWSELTGPGGTFEIVDAPVRGQMLRTYKNAPPNIRALWLSTAAYGDRDYLVYGDERVTYADAHARVAAVASWLTAQGVTRGDRVAIAMRNYPEWMLIYWACVCLGVAAVGMNAWWVPEEMEFGLKDSAPKVCSATLNGWPGSPSGPRWRRGSPWSRSALLRRPAASPGKA